MSSRIVGHSKSMSHEELDSLMHPTESKTHAAKEPHNPDHLNLKSIDHGFGEPHTGMTHAHGGVGKDSEMYGSSSGAENLKEE